MKRATGVTPSNTLFYPPRALSAIETQNDCGSSPPPVRLHQRIYAYRHPRFAEGLYPSAEVMGSEWDFSLRLFLDLILELRGIRSCF